MSSTPIAHASGSWRSRFGFVMASTGFAVGLGNIWRFPYVTGENGGAAFVLMYLAFAFAIGVPILMAEIMVGRRGRSSPPTALAKVAQASARSPRWGWVGYLTLTTAFLIMIAYSVVAGWVLYYFTQAVSFSVSESAVFASDDAFQLLLGDVTTLLIWTGVALTATGAIIFTGVEQGIERAVRVLMPTLFLLLIGLVIFNAFNGGMSAALAYLFLPDFTKLTWGAPLAALGQAFFSIGVAMAGMMMFGAYLPQDVAVGKSAVQIVIADTLVALIAGLVVFPMVFANGLDPSAGTGLIFKTLPVAFSQMPYGSVVAVLFFLLLSVAAVTSMVGLTEPLVGFLMERLQCSRRRATALVIGVLFAVSLISVLSYNHWQHVGFAGRSLAAWLDYIPNQVMLPLGGLLLALFAGWILNRQIAEDELAMASSKYVGLWRSLLRWLAVPAVAIILLTGL